MKTGRYSCPGFTKFDRACNPGDMKAPVLFCCFCCLVQAFSSFAQNYRCINPERIALYEGESSKEVLALRIDSVRISEGDTVLYPFYDIEPVEDKYGCFSPLEASWICMKMIIQDSSLNVFINKRNDSILIRTLADTGDTWDCYTKDSGFVIKATVVKIDTMGFLGITDSVKTIGFHAVYAGDSARTHPVNDLKIRISKSYGLITALNLNTFPDIEYKDPHYGPDFSLHEYSLVGLNDPDLGIHNLTWLEVHDYAVGDEIHTNYDEIQIHFIGSPDYHLNERTIKKIISRTDKEDTVCYQVANIRQRTYYELYEGNPIVTIFEYTESPCYTSDPFFDKLPREPYGSFSGHLDFYTMMNHTPPSKYWAKCMDFYLSDDNCWDQPICDGCFPGYVYTRGLGITNYGCSGGVEGSTSIQYDVVYYRKGTTQWGTPIVISSINRIAARPSCIFPNPFHDFIMVNLIEGNHTPCSFRIFDLNGKTVFARNLLDGYIHQLDLSFLSPGFYIYAIVAEHRLLDRGKLVKR